MGPIRYFYLVAAVVLIGGCATTPDPMDRDEFLNTTVRHYKNVSIDEFFRAAENLFLLLDPNDVEFSYPDRNSMIVSRSWLQYMVIAAASGKNTYRIRVESNNGGIKAQIYISHDGSGIAAHPTGSGGASAFSTPGAKEGVNTPAVYDLFWARMDYLLEESDYWPTCDDWEKKVKSGETRGEVDLNSVMCIAMMNTPDNHPNKLEEIREEY